MKLYLHKNEQGHVIVARRVPDDVVLEAPFILQPPEVYAQWAADQGWDQPGSSDPAPRSQDTDTILQRLTDAERAALFTARRSVWQLDFMLTRATSTGRISEGDPDFPAGRAMLDQLGIIGAARWDELLAP